MTLELKQRRNHDLRHENQGTGVRTAFHVLICVSGNVIWKVSGKTLSSFPIQSDRWKAVLTNLDASGSLSWQYQQGFRCYGNRVASFCFYTQETKQRGAGSRMLALPAVPHFPMPLTFPWPLEGSLKPYRPFQTPCTLFSSDVPFFQETTLSLLFPEK